MAYNHQQQFQQNDDYYNNNNWDSRSAKSYNTQHSAYSTQHLNPQYNNAPPVPQMPYAQQVIDYPPMQQPQVRFGAPYDRAPSVASGFSSARDKLMKRRVSTRWFRSRFSEAPPRLPAPPLFRANSNQTISADLRCF